MKSWEDMSFFAQLRANLGALSGLHRMHVSPDWHSDRTHATLEADRRIRTYEDARAARLAAYNRTGWSESYRGRRASNVVELHPERFSRVFGGER